MSHGKPLSPGERRVRMALRMAGTPLSKTEIGAAVVTRHPNTDKSVVGLTVSALERDGLLVRSAADANKYIIPGAPEAHFIKPEHQVGVSHSQVKKLQSILDPSASVEEKKFMDVQKATQGDERSRQRIFPLEKVDMGKQMYLPLPLLDQRVMLAMRNADRPLLTREIADAVVALYPTTNRSSVQPSVSALKRKGILEALPQCDAGNADMYIIKDAPAAHFTEPEQRTDASPKDSAQNDNPQPLVPDLSAGVSKEIMQAMLALANERHGGKTVAGVGRGTATVLRGMVKDFLLAAPYTHRGFCWVKVPHPGYLTAKVPPEDAWIVEEMMRVAGDSEYMRLPTVMDGRRLSVRAVALPVTNFCHTALVWGLINGTSEGERGLPAVREYLEYASEQFLIDGRDVVSVYRDIGWKIREAAEHARKEVAHQEAAGEAAADAAASQDAHEQADATASRNASGWSDGLSFENDGSGHVRIHLSFSLPEDMGAKIVRIACQILDQWTAPGSGKGA